ncbi:hypothetical protein GCM10023144_29630 [Pigmentiphaga soli]|uniref:SMODS and SLOG-associating 2TM effector domain-containing protein n=1 Tax=Pigmentiphaga soli TaxID=1007095 RepID=A0ABP8H8I8_9BURK
MTDVVGTVQTKEQLLGEIRYAQRLAQRTARLYRRIQAVGTFLAVLGGSGAMAGISNNIPPWISIAGGVLLAIYGAMTLSIRPADKAVPNEMDVKKYADLFAKAQALSMEEIRPLLAEARRSDAPEIESLRDIAFNDVAEELNRPDQQIKINWYQGFLQAIA